MPPYVNLARQFKPLLQGSLQAGKQAEPVTSILHTLEQQQEFVDGEGLLRRVTFAHK
jgi:hypothetical protein